MTDIFENKRLVGLVDTVLIYVPRPTRATIKTGDLVFAYPSDLEVENYPDSRTIFELTVHNNTIDFTDVANPANTFVQTPGYLDRCKTVDFLPYLTQEELVYFVNRTFKPRAREIVIGGARKINNNSTAKSLDREKAYQAAVDKAVEKAKAEKKWDEANLAAGRDADRMPADYEGRKEAYAKQRYEAGYTGPAYGSAKGDYTDPSDWAQEYQNKVIKVNSEKGLEEAFVPSKTGRIEIKSGTYKSEKTMLENTIDKNKTMAVTAGKVVAGRTINRVMKDKLVPFLPEGAQVLADSPVGTLVLANVMAALAEIYRGTSNSDMAHNLGKITDLMLEAAMMDAVDGLNIDGFVAGLLESPEIKAVLDQD
jgi:hypothetical protein